MKALPVRRLSGVLSLVAGELRDRFGLTRLAIGGSSAPALLDHLFTGSALRMRDFDLIALADRPVDQQLVCDIGQALEGDELRFLPRYIYPRMRAREDQQLWTAGWGVLWDSGGMEVDLSVFHDASALSLNGLMNVDRILVPFSAETSLNEVAARMLVAGNAEHALAEGLFEDPWGGYASWVRRSPVIIAWNAIHCAPIECAIRIVRAAANKLHLNHLNPEMADPLRAAVLFGHERGERFLRVRTLVKLFHDDRAGAELEMLYDLGVFEHWLPEVGEAIERVGEGGLVTLFANADRESRTDMQHHEAFAEAGQQGGDEVSAVRIEALLLQMSPTKRDRVLEEIAIAEPLFATLVRNQIPRVAARRAPRSGARISGRHRALRA
ncbi:MAG TPA: hypothetical protein VKB93_00435 [Thermoanaerobaculia bacterium]|nr:hypothetical protein [Thermoanaerobaculia bacterium]